MVVGELKPRLHQGNMLPGNMCPRRATCIRIHYVDGHNFARQQFARSGYMLTVSRRHNYYSFMSQSTCIPLYPATDEQQTGDNFVADTRNMLTATCCPGVNAA